MKEADVWKVLTTERKSARVGAVKGLGRVYPVGVPVKRNRRQLPLTAFARRRDARDFKASWNHEPDELIVCRARGVLSRDAPRTLVPLSALLRKYVPLRKVRAYVRNGGGRWPSGTVFCHEITCLE